ncbi:MAG: hypothetical protein S4CHLAM7_01690 [Chlamydiae bacterium]|nr:hypothetical protein [Chlamydiota bacterium]
MTSEVSIGSLNTLNPYAAVKFAEKEGLNSTGLKLLETNPSHLKTSVRRASEYKEYSNWEDRLPRIAQYIQTLNITAVQEADPQSIEDIKGQLSENYAVACSYSHGDPNKNRFGNAIFYNKEVAQLISTSCIEFHPDGEPSSNTRRAAVASFKVNNLVVNVLSAHLKGYYTREPNLETRKARQETGLKELELYTKNFLELTGDVCVLAGDFNEPSSITFTSKNSDGTPGESITESSTRIALLEKHGFENLTVEGVTEPAKERRIDYVFARLAKTDLTLSPTNLRFDNLDMYPQASDHSLTGARLIISNASQKLEA